MLLLTLEPFIRLGVLHLIPDPGDIDAEFRRTAMADARARTAGMAIDAESERRGMALYRDDFIRALRAMPDDDLRRYIMDGVPDAEPGIVDVIVSQWKAQHPRARPVRAPGPDDETEDVAQFRFLKGYTLETALYLASLTGSAVYTDWPTFWTQLLAHTSAATSATDAVWNETLDALRAVEFPLGVDSRHDTLDAGSPTDRPMRTRLAQLRGHTSS